MALVTEPAWSQSQPSSGAQQGQEWQPGESAGWWRACGFPETLGRCPFPWPPSSYPPRRPWRGEYRPRFLLTTALPLPGLLVPLPGGVSVCHTGRVSRAGVLGQNTCLRLHPTHPPPSGPPRALQGPLVGQAWRSGSSPGGECEAGTADT